jgi:hypothetical protein
MVLMHRICAWCNNEMGVVEVEDGNVEEIETHGLCQQCAKKYFDIDVEEDSSDSTNPISSKAQDSCILSKRAYNVNDFINAITGKKYTTSLGLRNVPGVDVNKAYDIFSQLESSKRFIVGDSGTSFGKTQVQIGSFLNAVANDPNAQQITGIPPGEMREFASEWKKSQERLSSFSWKKTVPVSLDSAESFKARNKNLVKERRDGTILRVSPNSNPGVIRIINGKAIGEYLDLSELQRLGLNVSSPDIINKINAIMQQFVTWAVVRNALGRVLAYQKMPEIHNKIMNVFSYNNVNKNEKLLDLTDKVSQSNLVAKIQDVANAARQYGYDTKAPGAFNIYQLIAIANASGSGRVIEFLKTKQPFGSGNLTYLDRANRKIQEVTGIPTSMPQNNGIGGFTSVANEEFDLVKNAKYTEQGFLYFPAQYADDIKSGKRKMAIRASDVPVDVNEIVMCMTHSGSKICEVRINSKNKMSLTRIEKAFGKRVAKSIEQQFGPGGQYFVIRFEPYKINMADDESKWKETLIEKDGVSLTRQKIKNHYMSPSIKKKIMTRIKDKPVLIYIGAGKNETVLKRNHNGKPIVITNADPDKKNSPNNYYYWVERKLLSIYEIFGKKTNIGFVDLALE